MNVVVAGASGFIGRGVVRQLCLDGHNVRRLVRGSDESPDAESWRPSRHEIDRSALESADVVVNLAGENIAGGRWTRTRRERLLRSRLDSTETLISAIAQAHARPRILINASAVGYYGNCGDREVTEASGPGTEFLSTVCREWEGRAFEAERYGVRVVVFRIGTVLGAGGGALAKMVPWFRMGLGGRLGSGRQWVSWISREDVDAAFCQAIVDPGWKGQINLVSPEPVRNCRFTAELGRAMRRPVRIPAPGWALRLALGRMADELLLTSIRAIPARLGELGFRFKHPCLEDALRSAMAPNRTKD